MLIRIFIGRLTFSFLGIWNNIVTQQEMEQPYVCIII